MFAQVVICEDIFIVAVCNILVKICPGQCVHGEGIFPMTRLLDASVIEHGMCNTHYKTTISIKPNHGESR